MQRNLFALILTCCILLTSPAFIPANNDLKFNLDVGQNYKLHTKAEQRISQAMGGAQQTMEQLIEYKMNYKVAEKQGELTTLKVNYDAFIYEISMQPYFSMAYDSENRMDKSEDNPFYTFLDNMMGEEFTVIIDKTGHVREVKGLNESIQRVIDKVEVANPMQKQQYAQQFKELMGDQNFKTSFEAITSIYPEKSVKLGESWTKSLTQEVNMPVQYVNKYTLSKVEKGQAVIDLHSDIMASDEQSQKNKISGTQKGTIRVDRNSGWIMDSKISNKLNGTVWVQNQQMPQGMEVPITVTSEITTVGSK